MTAPAHAHATDRKLSDAEIQELREKVKAFMETDVYPNEQFFHHNSPRRSEAGVKKMKELQAKTKAMGMWAPHLPAEAGGMGIGFMPYVYMNEILGRSPIAPMAFGSQAPDSGNAEILWQFGSKELQDKYMKPLVNGGQTLGFVCGPAAMVEDVPVMLQQLGVPPENVKLEKWSS